MMDPVRPNLPENTVTEEQRCRAAIRTLETLTFNLRTMSRRHFSSGARHRMGEILRLSEETVALLNLQLTAAKKDNAAPQKSAVGERGAPEETISSGNPGL